jgi:hypothetical protein
VNPNASQKEDRSQEAGRQEGRSEETGEEEVTVFV